MAASKFYAAEDYHQKFYKKSPARYKAYKNACGRQERLQDLWQEYKPAKESELQNPEISLDQLHEKWQKLSSQELILDVRSEDEFNTVHIPGSKNIPHTEVLERINELENYENIYIYCRMGGRAHRAFESVQGAVKGKNIYFVGEGGIDMWVEKGYEVKK